MAIVYAWVTTEFSLSMSLLAALTWLMACCAEAMAADAPMPPMARGARRPAVCHQPRRAAQSRRAAAAPGRLDPELDEQLEPTRSRILILHSVSLVPEWQGLGLGARLAGTAIRKLSGASSAAVCYPAPLNELTESGPDDQGDADWNKAVAALQQVWARLGFEHFRDGVHVLDLSLVTLDETLGQLRKNAERYRTIQD